MPAGCGKYDILSAVPPASPGRPEIPMKKDSFTENGFVILLVKMCAGFLNPVGLVIGLVAGIIEGIPKAGTPFGVAGGPPTTPPGVDPPNADAAPTAAGQDDGRPENLVIPSSQTTCSTGQATRTCRHRQAGSTTSS